MKVLARSLLLLLLCVSLQALAAEQPQRGLLWEISGPGISKPSYLFGTIHSEDKRVLALPEVVTRAFNGSSLFMMEIVPSPSETAKAGMRMILPSNQSLVQLLGKPLYQQTVQVMQQEYSMPEETTSRLKPWAITLVLSVPKPETGRVLDEQFYAQALHQKKLVKGLESTDEQIDVFDTLPMKIQVMLLRQTLNEYKSIPEQTEEMIDAWLQRDLTKIQQLGDESDEGLPDDVQQLLDQRLIDVRNQHMAERMAPNLQQGGVFVAVGALHLPGEHGLIALLRQRGYTVTPIY